MDWQSVDATCDCPHKIDSHHVFVSSIDVDDVHRAKADVDEAMARHLDESEHCSEETVRREIYWQDSW